jgi:hypothetical protein
MTEEIQVAGRPLVLDIIHSLLGKYLAYEGAYWIIQRFLVHYQIQFFIYPILR